MASLLLRTDPWIESTFLYASSFDPETFQEHNDDDDVVVGRVGRGGREGGGGAGEEEEEEEEEEEGRTEDTVPPGLLSSQRRWRASSSLDANDEIVPPPAHPPSRRGKFVQVICSGGDADYYCRRGSPDDDDDDGSSLLLPPHLVVHDGEYSAIAFLSPEACAALMMSDVDGGTSALAMPPRRSLIGVSRYTVSTVLRCCTRPPAAATAAAATPTPPPPPSLPSSADRGVDGEGGGEGEGEGEGEEDDLDKTLPLPEDAQAEIDDAARRREIRAGLESHHRILSSLLFTDVPDHRRRRRSRRRRSSAAAAAAAPSHPTRRPPASSSSSVARPYHRQLIPTELQRQLLMQVPDSRLCMCLYLQGPIANVGAENGGMIGDPVDVHCSVKLRRALMAHVRLYGGGGGDDFDGHRDDGRPVPGRRTEEEEGLGYSHSVLIRRLEAVHCYYFWLDRRGRRMNNRTFGNDDDDALSGENIIPEWPWESRLIVDDLDRSSPPPFDERDNNSVVVVVVDPGEGGDRRTDAAAAIEGGGGGGGEGGTVVRENEHNIDDGDSREVANVDAHEGGDPVAIGGRIGTDEPTAATAAAAARSRPRKYHGDVNELFLDFQDIDDVLGLDDLEFASASAAPPPENRDDAIRTHLEIDAARAADEDSGASAEDDDEDGNEFDDLGGKEIDEGDDGPTFVGIDDMIVDDEDDSDEDEKGEGGDSDDDSISRRKIMDHACDGETRRVLTRQPERAAHDQPGGDLVDTDEDAMAKEFDNTESQIILPSYPVVRASKRTINREQSAVEQEIELETRRRRKSKKKAALRRRPREYDSGDSSDDNYDRRGSQIPIHLRKAPPETLGLSSTTGMYHNYGRVLESQISLPLRKAPKEPVGWTDEEEEKAEEELSRQESQIYLMRNRKKQYPAEMHHGGEKRVININATTTATTMMSKLSKERTSRNEQQESVIVESQIPLHLMSRRLFCTTLRSTQNNHDNSEDSSDEWMKVRRCKPAQRSRSVASPPKQMTTHAAGATAASDESTESLFESQIAGEGSEESVPPPPPPPPIVSSSRKESSAATTTTTYHHEDDTDDDENQNPMETIRGEGDVREKIYKAPLIPPNNHSYAYGGGNGGGPDHHRVRFDIDRTSNTIMNCEMSSISTRASNILGLSTSPTCTTTLVSRHEPRNEEFRTLKFGDISDDEGNNVARNKRKLKARKQFDIAQVLERAKRLCGL